MDITAYMQRIGYSGPLAPTLDTLQSIHSAHLLAIPFENLDIHRAQTITLDETAFFDKLVTRRRGGFCYEMNGLFAVVLRTLGFDVTLLSARVMGGEGRFGPEFDHLVLLVKLGQRWLADVGFGASFLRPLLLDERGEQAREGEVYRLEQAAGSDDLILRWRKSGGEWEALFAFTLKPRQLSEFAGMCHYQQTSPQSHFTKGRFCTIATPQGRVTLTDDRLIVTRDGQRTEHPFSDEETFDAHLRQHFGISLPESAN